MSYEHSNKRDRQYGPMEQIRPDHLKRYILATKYLQKMKVLDLACGCGYGSWLLHGAGNEVTGVDIEPEAIAYAEKHYQGPTYLCQPGEETQGEWDALVTFETLEHLDHPETILAIEAPIVIASVPNEERNPFKAEKFAGDKYPHKRHYTPKQFEALLNDSGIQVVEWFCQQNKLGEIVPGTEGMFIIAIGKK